MIKHAILLSMTLIPVLSFAEPDVNALLREVEQLRFRVQEVERSQRISEMIREPRENDDVPYGGGDARRPRQDALGQDNWVGVTTNVEAGYLGETGTSGVLRVVGDLGYTWVPGENWITLDASGVSSISSNSPGLPGDPGSGAWRRPFDLLSPSNGESVVYIRGDLDWSTWIGGVEYAASVGINVLDAGGGDFSVTVSTSTLYVWLEVDDTDAGPAVTINAGTTLPDGSTSAYQDANGLRNAVEILPLWIIGTVPSTGGFNPATTYDMRNNYNLYRLG